MIHLVYAPDLVEEAVLLAEASTPAAGWRTFRRERDRLYRLREDDEREERFRALHLLQFKALDLHEALEHAVAERSDICDRVGDGRILRAVRRSDEGGDLLDRVVPGGTVRPVLAIRLRPATLLEPDLLRAFLRHELMHVGDMLDPAFGYERALPPSQDGPSADNILRDRYRVLWDVTIDGRLARASLADPSARDRRWSEFSATFAMLGEECPAAFERWFASAQPTHAELLAFAMTPSRRAPGTGRCALCRFPVASFDRRVETLSAPTLAAIRAGHPGWRPTDGLCPQCLDLYEARSAVRS